MNAPEKVSQIVPRWLGCFHPLGQYRQPVNRFFKHLLVNRSFHKTDDHQRNELQKCHSFDAGGFFKKDRRNV